MAFTEFEQALAEVKMGEFMERRRPPEELREQLDLGFRIEDQSIVIFSIRPAYRSPGEVVECPVAKATYVKSSKKWKVFWQRADLRWHRYKPVPETRSLEEFLEVVDEDAYGSFWG